MSRYTLIYYPILLKGHFGQITLSSWYQLLIQQEIINKLLCWIYLFNLLKANFINILAKVLNSIYIEKGNKSTVKRQNVKFK